MHERSSIYAVSLYAVLVLRNSKKAKKNKIITILIRANV